MVQDGEMQMKKDLWIGLEVGCQLSTLRCRRWPRHGITGISVNGQDKSGNKLGPGCSLDGHRTGISVDSQDKGGIKS